MSDYFPDFPPEADTQQETPHAVDAERAVLGALLMNNDLFIEINDGDALREEYFYDKRHRIIYNHMKILHSTNYVDMLLLAKRLRDSNQLAEAGGEEYIAEITAIGAAPANIKAYAELISDMAFLRNLLNAHNEGISEGFHPGGKTPQQLLDAAETRLSLVSDLFRRGSSSISKIADVSGAYEAKIFDNRHDMSALRGLHPGFDYLYKQTHGLRGGDLIILAGRPGAGKTAFGLNLLRNIASQPNTGAMCFSLEMSAEQLVMRMLSHHGLDMHKMYNADSISAPTLSQLATASSKLEELPIYIDDSGTLNILEARTRARRIKREMAAKGIKLGLIMVDYLQLMEAGSGGNSRIDSRALEVSIISRGLKALAKELDTPIVALSQLNRGMEKRADPRPMMSDLRESGAIEQDADLILFLYNKKAEESKAPGGGDSKIKIELIIGKQRNGPTGVVYLQFDKSLSLFKEATKHHGDGDGDEH